MRVVVSPYILDMTLLYYFRVGTCTAVVAGMKSRPVEGGGGRGGCARWQHSTFGDARVHISAALVVTTATCLTVRLSASRGMYCCAIHSIGLRKHTQSNSSNIYNAGSAAIICCLCVDRGPLPTTRGGGVGGASFAEGGMTVETSVLDQVRIFYGMGVWVGFVVCI